MARGNSEGHQDRSAPLRIDPEAPVCEIWAHLAPLAPLFTKIALFPLILSRSRVFPVPPADPALSDCPRIAAPTRRAIGRSSARPSATSSRTAVPGPPRSPDSNSHTWLSSQPMRRASRCWVRPSASRRLRTISPNVITALSARSPAEPPRALRETSPFPDAAAFPFLKHTPHNAAAGSPLLPPGRKP